MLQVRSPGAAFRLPQMPSSHLYLLQMTPKQQVQRLYPKAFSEENGQGYQIVVLGAYAVATVLGFAYKDKRAAWADAARNLQVKPSVYNKRNGIDSYPCWAVYIGRPSKWGNPFVVGRDGTREEVIVKFEKYLKDRTSLLEAVKTELRGKDLLCYCSPLPCHGDVLLRIANEI